MQHVSYEAADRVAEKLSRILGRPPWLRGIGIDRSDGQDYVVTVRVAKDGEVPTLPDSIDGVVIHIVRRGLARALEDAQ
jgi:hypothetical protein